MSIIMGRQEDCLMSMIFVTVVLKILSFVFRLFASKIPGPKMFASSAP